MNYFYLPRADYVRCIQVPIAISVDVDGEIPTNALRHAQQCSGMQNVTNLWLFVDLVKINENYTTTIVDPKIFILVLSSESRS